ncbi:MAG: MerR family transcriptional regulator [Candidatus Binatia bacterium]
MATSRKRTPASDATAAAAPPPVGETLRMRDLVRLTGLPRETIHFYLAQGLLPKPVKTGRNTAVYSPEHLERLQRVKDLQERHFLPLRAIKAVLEEGAGGEFSEEQEAMLRRVRASQPSIGSRSGVRDVGLSAIVPSRVSRADLEELRKLGYVTVSGRGRDATVSADDASLLEAWAEVAALFRPGEERMTPDVLGLYDDAMESLVAREARLLTRQYAGLPGERAAEIIEAGEPVILRLLGAFRRKKITALLEGAPPPPR